MRVALALVTAAFASSALATLPPPTEDAKMRAMDTAAKAVWSDKVASYKTCLAMERTVDAYRRGLKAEGKEAPAPVPTPACADPGPYVSPVTAMADKPLEASGAHSPPETATAPPSQNKTADQVSKAGKP